MIICADDYGLRPDINRAILELARASRLTAASCMVALESCTPAILAEILPLGERLDLGLHFCLTEEPVPLSVKPLFGRGAFPRFGELLQRSLTGRIHRNEIHEQAARQYRLFVEKAGRAPDYIDGHLHAHQLPGIRDGLLDFIGTLPAGQRPYLRNTALPMKELRRRRLPVLKAALVGMFGSGLLARARRTGVPTNEGFAGIYDFKQWQRYPEYFPRFIDCLGARTGILVMHPGADEDWRRQEAEVLRRWEVPPGRLNRFRV
jgi:hypothetical protein